jgi:hypothetical protein
MKETMVHMKLKDEELTSRDILAFKLTGYERIDNKLDEPAFQKYVKDHALHDTLKGEGLIEKYQVYKSNTDDEILCVITLGGKINGHPKIVHGGITAMLFDNSFGWWNDWHSTIFNERCDVRLKFIKHSGFVIKKSLLGGKDCLGLKANGVDWNNPNMRFSSSTKNNLL